MTVVMKMDVASPLRLKILISVFLLILAVALIIGAAGPQMNEDNVYYAYECPDDSHTWNPDVCTGVQLRDQNNYWEREFPQMHEFNRLWILDVKPYKWHDFKDSSFSKELIIKIEMWGSNDNDIKKKWEKIKEKESKDTVDCNHHNDDCNKFLVINEDFIDFDYYKVRVSFKQSDALEYMGDVQFTLLRYNKAFSVEALVLRILFLIAAFALLIAYLIAIKRSVSGLDVRAFSFEQKAAALLLLSLIFFNDPFFGFSFLSKGWFFLFLDSAFETIFISLLMLFWLFIADKFRREDRSLQPNLLMIGQILAVGLYAIMTLILFSWSSIKAAQDPIYSERGIDGLTVMFWLTSAVYGIILIWLLVLVVFGVPNIKKPYVMNRFIHFILPVVICVFGVIIGIFVGTMGPFNRDSVGFCFTIFLYNSYIWLLIAQVWPVDTDMDIGEALMDDEERTLKSGAVEDPSQGKSVEMKVTKVHRADSEEDEASMGGTALSIHDEL